MGIGDLVAWKDESEAEGFPWFYDDWKDVGIIVDLVDPDTVLVKWCSGEKFPVWIRDLEILSENKLISEND